MNKLDYLNDRIVVIGVCGVSTAYKSASLVEKLRNLGAEIRVILNEEAEKFLSPLTFERVSGHSVAGSSQAHGEEQVKDDTGTPEGDITVIAPASFSFIGKLASGLDNDLLTQFTSTSDQPVVIVPSLDPKLYSSEKVTNNLQNLRDRGYHIVEPASKGKDSGDSEEDLPLFPSRKKIIRGIRRIFRDDTLLADKKVIVTAGPTRRSFNSEEQSATQSRSSLGFQLSQQARQMGGEVLLVSGPTEQIPPSGVGVVWTRTAEELDELLLEEISDHDLILMAGSAIDWETRGMIGLSKEEKTMKLDLDLDERPDVLRKLGKLKEDDQALVSIDFSPVGSDFNPKEKMEENNLDAYFYRDKRDEQERLNSNFLSGKLLFKTGPPEEFRARNTSRLTRVLLKKTGIELFQNRGQQVNNS